MHMPLVLSIIAHLAIGASAAAPKPTTITKTVVKTKTISSIATRTISTTATTTVTSHTPGPTNFSYLQCYVDNGQGDNDRLLGDKSDYTGDISSVEDCAAFCDGYQYFGLEFGNECYCGNAFNYDRVLSTNCRAGCPDNAAEICGGLAALSTFEFLS